MLVVARLDRYFATLETLRRLSLLAPSLTECVSAHSMPDVPLDLHEIGTAILNIDTDERRAL
jgi:hypothetical protein